MNIKIRIMKIIAASFLIIKFISNKIKEKEAKIMLWFIQVHHKCDVYVVLDTYSLELYSRTSSYSIIYCKL